MTMTGSHSTADLTSTVGDLTALVGQTTTVPVAGSERNNLALPAMFSAVVVLAALAVAAPRLAQALNRRRAQREA